MEPGHVASSGARRVRVLRSITRVMVGGVGSAPSAWSGSSSAAICRIGKEACGVRRWARMVVVEVVLVAYRQGRL